MPLVPIPAVGTASARLRSDLVEARATLRQAVAAPPDARVVAAARLDRALAALCPHDPEHWHTDRDPHSGRLQTACGECCVSWHADYGKHLWVRDTVGERRAAPHGADGADALKAGPALASEPQLPPPEPRQSA